MVHAAGTHHTYHDHPHEGVQMDVRLDPADLQRWCRVPADGLPQRPDLKISLRVAPRPDDVHRLIAEEMVEEVTANNARGRPTRWILPCGPTGQYEYFAAAVNRDRIPLHRLHVFHMDDFLDWQARPLSDGHPFSLKGWMLRHFYRAVDPDLAVPADNRHFPDPFRPDDLSAAIARAGGVDTAWGGIGYRGHVAFNEPPRSPWWTVTVDEFRASKTRIVVLNDDTLIAQSQREAGGCSQVVPPLAITIGMADLLAAGRVRLFSVTGAWKQAAIRVAIFGPQTIEYPVTLFQGHPDASILVDSATAAAPLGDSGA